VSATTDARVWTLERDVFRDLTRTAAMASDAGNLVFLNSVPLLASLTFGERVRLAEALEEKTFKPGETVVTQGEVGDMFYIVRKGEAVVTKRSMSTGHLSFGDGSVHGGRRSREGSVHGGRRSREGSVYGGRRSREGSDHGASQLAQMLANGGGEDAASAATENDANASSPSPPPSPGPVASPSGHERVNHLFRGDFFGEKALLTRKPREATVTAVGSSALVCLCLNAPAFEDLLGPLEQLMERAKSPEIVAQRMNAIENEGRWARARFIIKSDKSKSDGGPGGGGGGGGGDGDASGDENGEGSVAIGACAAETFAGTFSNDSSMAEITLHERELLGGGASGYVRLVVADVCGNGTMKSFALKRMRKCAVVSTPDHVYCEQSVSQELNHFACVRQHASFQDADHLYFLFDHLDGCDMMDALAAVATVQPFKNPDKPTGSKIKMLKGMPEEMAMYYVAVVTLALEYLHEKQIVYRDLKPENVFLANDGTAVLGDFGFSKKLEKDALTYTFCGTPGYVAPEVILAHGYSTSVDWWGLGVMTYVLLTGQQPFSQIVKGKPEDPLTVMKRIVDRSWAVSFPVYISESAVDLMSWFLERRRARRLGNLRRKAEDVKTHAWFKDAKFDWDAMQRGQLKPRPLALSEAFATQRANRIADLEREIATATFAETEEEIEDAKETFRAF
jgi:cGMP-dependent protein kinase 2